MYLETINVLKFMVKEYIKYRHLKHHLEICPLDHNG